MEIKFSTQKYMYEFMEWIDNNGYGALVEGLEIAGSGGFATLNMTSAMMENITELFEIIILERSGMINANERLRELLHIAVFEPGRDYMCRVFENYIAENDCLNLEGFAIFRLGEFSALVDIALYKAVKKILY